LMRRERDVIVAKIKGVLQRELIII
jgi:hypothetical protein